MGLELPHSISAEGDITASIIDERFVVDPAAGLILNRDSTGRGKKGRARAGFIKPGAASSGGGYRMIGMRINGAHKTIRAHHLIWLYVHGERPRTEIDHINGDRDDNRIANLRAATVSQNRINRRTQSNNKSGYKWVAWHAASGRWRAEIAATKEMGLGRKRLHSSFHSTPEEAYSAACEAAKKIFGEWYNPGKVG